MVIVGVMLFCPSAFVCQETNHLVLTQQKNKTKKTQLINQLSTKVYAHFYCISKGSLRMSDQYVGGCRVVIINISNGYQRYLPAGIKIVIPINYWCLVGMSSQGQRISVQPRYQLDQHRSKSYILMHSKLCSITPVATQSARDITEFYSVDMVA